MRHVIVDPDAEEDIREILHWYDEQGDRLAGDFLMCLDEAIAKAAAHPQSYRIIRGTTRRVILRRFPYLLLFRDTTDVLNVVGVFHTRRSPRTYRKR